MHMPQPVVESTIYIYIYFGRYDNFKASSAWKISALLIRFKFHDRNYTSCISL